MGGFNLLLLLEEKCNRSVSKACRDNASTDKSCREWFQRFKDCCYIYRYIVYIYMLDIFLS